MRRQSEIEAVVGTGDPVGQFIVDIAALFFALLEVVHEDFDSGHVAFLQLVDVPFHTGSAIAVSFMARFFDQSPFRFFQYQFKPVTGKTVDRIE